MSRGLCARMFLLSYLLLRLGEGFIGGEVSVRAALESSHVRIGCNVRT